jgi:hypothetical protein
MIRALAVLLSCGSHPRGLRRLGIWRVGASDIGANRHTAAGGIADNIGLDRHRPHLGWCVSRKRRTAPRGDGSPGQWSIRRLWPIYLIPEIPLVENAAPRYKQRLRP